MSAKIKETIKYLKVNRSAVFASNAYIDGGAGIGAVDAFTATATKDTVVFNSNANVDANSIFVISIKDATPDTNEVIGWTSASDTLFVYRAAGASGATSALAYSYLRIQ